MAGQLNDLYAAGAWLRTCEEQAMAVDTKKIKEARAKERERAQPEFRQILALEQIADTLEAIRAEFVGFQVSLLREIGRRGH